MWKREDGKSLDGLEQRFKHEIKRAQANQIMSIDSSELVINSVSRNHSGAYLVSCLAWQLAPDAEPTRPLIAKPGTKHQCIASNGVQPGVSQRVSVALANCRRPDAGSPGRARMEPCGSQLAAADEHRFATADDEQRGSTRSPTSGTAEGHQQRRQQRPPADKRRTALAKGPAANPRQRGGEYRRISGRPVGLSFSIRQLHKLININHNAATPTQTTKGVQLKKYQSGRPAHPRRRSASCRLRAGRIGPESLICFACSCSPNCCSPIWRAKQLRAPNRPFAQHHYQPIRGRSLPAERGIVILAG